MNRRRGWKSVALWTTLSALLGVQESRAQKEAPEPKEPKYPHVNLAISYQVDSKWPQKPKEFVWGHVPGIAVDAKDNVYVFTRATPPVQVYDASGRYVRGWGEKSIGPLGAHHIKIDAEGNVWTSDIVNHTVEK